MALRTTFIFAAGLAAGLAAVWAGVRLLPTPPTPAPISMPPAAPAAAQPASLADIQRLTSDFERALALFRLASRQDAAGVERLLGEAAASGPPSELVPTLSILYARYADLDPAAALRHILARGDTANRWLDVVFHAWARSDLSAALRGFETLAAHQRAIAGAAIARAGNGLPPEERAELAAGLSPRQAVEESAAAALASDVRVANGPAQAWQQALRQQASQSRWDEIAQAMEQAILDWARTDPLAALDAIDSATGIHPRLRTGLRAQAISAWAAAEPRAALEWAMARSDSQSRSDMVTMALGAWDPRAAAQWLTAQADPALRRKVLPSVAIDFAIKHPEEAVDWFLTLPADDLLAPPEDDRPSPMVMAFHLVVRNAPERAARLLAHIADADARDSAERQLVQSWAAADPDAALAWLDRLAETDPARSEALTSSLLMNWARRDIAAAMRHLDRLADAGTRDNTVLSMLRTALRFDVSIAESLFERIETEDVRRDAAKLLYEHLARIDPERAKRYR